MDALTISVCDVDVNSDTFSLSLESPYLANKERIRGIEHFSSLEKLAALRDSLEQDTAGGRLNCELSPERCVKLLEDFRELGSAAFITFLGGPAYKGRQQRVQRYFKNVFEKAPAGRVHILAVSSPFDLPLDLMTIMDDGEDFDPGSGPLQIQAGRLAVQASSCFIGFQFAVRKTGLHMEPIERSLVSADGQTNVFPYWHQNIRSVDEEIERLRKFAHFNVADPMPDVTYAKQEDPGRKLARRLAKHVDEEIDIVHFTCHCDAAAKVPPLEHKLILAARDRFRRFHKVGVAVRNIQGASRYSDEHDAPVGPLAFLSACAAADMSYESPTSIPSALLDSGYRAVIAPIVSVNFRPALEIAMLFYAALGKDSNTVGGALVDARTEFLKRFCNPLGLLYSCYGDNRLEQLYAETVG